MTLRNENFSNLRLIAKDIPFLNRKLGPKGEISYDQVSNTLRVYNGTVLGGEALLKADLSNLDITGDINFGDGALLASSFVGPLTGNVTGNLTGNVTGNLTGNVTGNVTGNLTGLHTGDVTGNVTGNVTGTLTGSVIGNAATATKLATARTINGISFDGTGNITVTANANTLTGDTLNPTVTNSSLTSTGTLTDLTVAGDITANSNVVVNALPTQRVHAANKKYVDSRSIAISVAMS